MSINLNKYRSEILAAWKDVLDDKTSTDWALFGYEGSSNDLMVLSKGDGGINELKDDLHSAKIMYAFCKVLDPKTSLKKFVFIIWQGDGTPLVRKGVCANHVHDVANILKGFHVTVNARTEDDIEYDLIIDKVKKSTSSAYSFDERLDLSKDGFQKVKPAYKKVEPHREINPAERNKFWAQEEELEKCRQLEETKKRRDQQLRLEKECMEREAADASKREQTSIDTESVNDANRSSINKIREETKMISQLRKTDAHIPSQTSDRSEEMRKMRNKEAEELISKRTINARAVFEQNSSVGQLSKFNKPPSTKINSSITASSTNATNHLNGNQINNSQMATNNNTIEQNKLEINTNGANNNYSQNITKNNNLEEHNKPNKNNHVDDYDDIDVQSKILDIPDIIQEQQPHITADQIYLGEDFGIQAQALYDYQAADETEISFDPGDIITHIEQIDPGWWQGLAPDGTFGLFPANYVELIS